MSRRNTNLKIIPLSHETKIIKFPNILWLYEVVDLISLVEFLKEYRSIFKERREIDKPEVFSASWLSWFKPHFLSPQDVAAMVVGKEEFRGIISPLKTILKFLDWNHTLEFSSFGHHAFLMLLSFLKNLKFCSIVLNII